MRKVARRVRTCGRSLLGIVCGSYPRVHRIPFGPIRGRKLFMSPQISPRMWFGIGEPWIAQLCKSQIRPDSVIYDVGAHIGYTTVLFAHYLKGTGVIHAFEILPSTAALLRNTVEANGLQNVVIHVVGLGAEEAIQQLPVGSTAMTSIHRIKRTGQRNERCKIVALDMYRCKQALPLPSLMKVDIEGAEIEFLQGSLELIDECCPAMIIAFHSKDLLQQGYSLLTSLGYRLYNERDQLTEKSVAGISGYFNSNILCLPRDSVGCTMRVR